MPIQKATKDFKCHVALTGKNVNGGAANEHNVSCITKASMTITDELAILKRLGKATPEAVEKASYRNIQKQLEAALQEKLKSEDDEDYHWIWIQDFDDSTVIFESGETSYSIGFTVSEKGIVELNEEEAVEVIRQDVYVKSDGSELILKGAEETEAVKEESPDDITDSEVQEGEVMVTEPSDIDNENNEDIMSETKVELTQEQIVEKAVQDALKVERETVAQEKLLAETTEIVKGLSVEDSSASILVKAFSENSELAEVVLKEFAAKDALVLAAQEEVVQVKAKFGDKKQVVDESNPAPIEKSLSRTEQMKANAQAQIAAKNA